MRLSVFQSFLLGHEHGVDLVHLSNSSLKWLLISYEFLNISIDLTPCQLHFPVFLEEILNKLVKSLNDLINRVLSSFWLNALAL